MANARYESVVPNKKFCLVLKFVALLSLCTSVQAEADFTVWVNRRISSDLYQLNSGPSLRCDSTVETYLINENRCVSNEELFSGCSYAVTPTRHSSFLITIATIDNQSESTITNIMDIHDVIGYAVSFSFNKTKQPVNSSFCDISNLKVIRGKKQVIEISHQGFFLNENGSVEIHKNQLTYNAEEYMGEFYRMNLFCSGGGLPESGCLFFKVAGRTNTTNDKFNNTVPGTLVGIQPYGNLTESPAFTETNITTNASVLTMVEPTSKVSILIVGSTLFYTVIGVGGGVIVLTFSFIIVCVLIGLSVQRKRKSYTSEDKPCLANVPSILKPMPTHPDTTVQDDATVILEPNTCQRNPAYFQLGPVDGSQADLVSGSYSENPAYNIDAKTSSFQEPIYEVIFSDTDGTSHTVQGTQNIHYNQNPAYVHLGAHVEENFQADPTAPSDYSQNPAYGIHSNTN